MLNQWAGAVLRGTVRVLLAAFGLIFVLSLVVAGLVAALVWTLWSLLRGRRPGVAWRTGVDVFGNLRSSRWSDRQARSRGGAAAAQRPSAASGDVIDIEAREVRAARPSLDRD